MTFNILSISFTTTRDPNTRSYALFKSNKIKYTSRGITNSTGSICASVTVACKVLRRNPQGTREGLTKCNEQHGTLLLVLCSKDSTIIWLGRMTLVGKSRSRLSVMWKQHIPSAASLSCKLKTRSIFSARSEQHA